MAVVGPTAAGKSGLAVEIAAAIGGEVVNADSMQLYRGMDIGTAKLTWPQRRGIPHHLLDIWPVTQSANVAEYQRLGRAVLQQVIDRGSTPVLVGGSGLYVRGILDRMEFPGTDAALRAGLEAELAEAGPAALHARLAVADSAAAAAILPGNGRRVVRALEVIALTGRPFAATRPAHESIYDAVHIGIDPPVDRLDRRIDARVGQMYADGLIEEVRALLADGLREGRTARRAVGYAQVLRLLGGQLTEAEAREATSRATRRLARRQRSWFRQDPRLHWLDRPDLGAALDAVRRRRPTGQ